MVPQLRVSPDAVENVHEGLEELFVLASVKALRELLQVGDVTDDGKHIG